MQIKFTPQKDSEDDNWCSMKSELDSQPNEAVVEVHRKGEVECTDPVEWCNVAGCYDWKMESLTVPLTMFLESARAKEFLSKEVIIKVRHVDDMECLGEAILDVAHYISPSMLTAEVRLETGTGTLEMMLYLDVLGAVRRHVHQILDKATGI